MKIMLVMLLCASSVLCMNTNDPERPRYHINNKVIYLHKTHDGETAEFRTVTDFNKEHESAIMREAKPQDTAIIQTGMTNRNRIVIALITSSCTLGAALISALVTYYSTNC